MTIQPIQLSPQAYRLALLCLLLTAIALLLLNQFTTLDTAIEDYYYNAALKQFVWKNSWFAKDLMHGYFKYALQLLGALLLVTVLADAIKPSSAISQATRVRLRFVSLAAVMIPLVISLFKRHSMTHCPWDVSRYGGDMPYIKLLDFPAIPLQAGHCFPAGHATTGLWLASLCVFWLPHRPKIAGYVFWAGLSLGLALGWVQQMRGAHFLSHTLWSAWIASGLIVMQLALFERYLQKKAS